MWGCESSFLDEQPYSFVSPEVFYESAKDAEIGLNGVYRNLNRVWNESYFFCHTLGTDEMAYGKVHVNNTPNAAYTYSSTTGLQRDLWIDYYKGINSANILLDHVPEIDMNEDRKEEIMAEARFLRAFYYYNLANMFGGVPLDTTSVVETDLSRASLEETYSFVIEQLEWAYADLPAEAYQPGKVNKDAAAAILAKTGLYLGSCKEYSVGNEVAAAYLNPELVSFDWVNQTEMYKMAHDYAASVYGNYQLIANYSDLFYAEKEIIAFDETVFGVQFHVMESDPYYLSIQKAYYPKGKRMLGGGLGWNSPTSEMYSIYEETDIRRDHNLTDELHKKNYTIIDGSKYFDVIPVKNGKAKNFSCGKWRHSSFESRPNMPDYAADINMHIVRYADILLMYAEATYKHLNDEEAARALLTELRTRVVAEGTEVADLDAAYNDADFMIEILAERSRELCFEGWRRQDLIRTNKLEEHLMAIDPTKTKPGKFNANVTITQENYEPYKIWFPIPLREMDLNDQLIQNPNW